MHFVVGGDVVGVMAAHPESDFIVRQPEMFVHQSFHFIERPVFRIGFVQEGGDLVCFPVPARESFALFGGVARFGRSHHFG